jgi:hypothetical protein
MGSIPPDIQPVENSTCQLRGVLKHRLRGSLLGELLSQRYNVVLRRDLVLIKWVNEVEIC